MEYEAAQMAKARREIAQTGAMATSISAQAPPSSAPTMPTTGIVPSAASRGASDVAAGKTMKITSPHKKGEAPFATEMSLMEALSKTRYAIFFLFIDLSIPNLSESLFPTIDCVHRFFFVPFEPIW